MHDTVSICPTTATCGASAYRPSAYIHARDLGGVAVLKWVPNRDTLCPRGAVVMTEDIVDRVLAPHRVEPLNKNVTEK